MSFEKSFKKIFANVFFSQKVFLHLHIIFNHFKYFIMKRSDYVIIAIGVLVIAAIFVGIVYAAIIFNNGNGGLNGGF